jgi:hypothetical protein
MAYSPLGNAPYGDQSSTFSNNLYLLGQNQQQAQNVATPFGTENITGATQNLNQAAAYDTGILSGNRSTILSTEAPEIGSVLAQYDGARKAAAQLQPRGGGRSQILNELPYKEAGDVNKLIESARPEAAKNLSAVAGQQAALGTSEQQLASSDVQNSLDFLLGKAGVQLNWAEFNTAQGAQQGEQMGKAAAQLAMIALAA